MIGTRKLFGITRIDEKDIEGTENKLQINLKYYKVKLAMTKSRIKKYGIEIVKEEINKRGKTKEKSKIYNITNNEMVIENLLKIFIQNKVTPIATNEIISDLKKKPELIYNFKG